MAGRGRGRPRKKRGRPPADETCQYSSSLDDSKDEDFVPSSKFSRYPTRSSRAINLSQAATLRSPLRNPVRNVKRSSCLSSSSLIVPIEESLSGNRDNSIPEFQHCTSKQPLLLYEDNTISNGAAGSSRHLPSPDNTKTKADKSVTSESLNWSAPISQLVMDLDKFVLHKNNFKTAAGGGGGGGGGNSQQQQQQCLSRTGSFNITEFAKRLHDDDVDDEDPDEEEVESAPEPGFDFVNGHKVKSEIAPLLKRVFGKYGDITTETDLESPNSLSNFLRQLCGVYEKLERTKFLQLTRPELDGMLADVRDCERVKLNVGWLREKLEFVSGTWTSYRQYSSLKEEVGRYDVSVESVERRMDVLRTELSELQQEISAGEAELAARRAKADRVRAVLVDTKARVENLVKQNLADGLL
ncbi:hypothetical protein OROMI_019299 [Orobanche minor]